MKEATVPDVVVWQADVGRSYCSLTTLFGVSDDYEIGRGTPRAAGFPSGAYFEMDKKFPRRLALSDCLYNIEGMVVVSERLNDLIAAENLQDVEILPVGIKDHKGGLAKQPYFIVHPTAIVDCIDQNQGDLTWSTMKPVTITGCAGLFLNPVALPLKCKIFRPRHLESAVLVARDLADRIISQGFTGVRFVELWDFEG